MNRIVPLIASFFRLRIVFTPPSGITPDKPGMYGLMGLIRNLNQYAQSLSSVATSGTDVTLTAPQMVVGTVQINTGASGAFTITTPTASAIVAELGNTVPLDGTFSKIVNLINNNVAQTGTLTAGTGVTVVGTATIATDTKRSFMLRVLNSAAVTLSNQGSVAL